MCAAVAVAVTAHTRIYPNGTQAATLYCWHAKLKKQKQKQ